MKEHLETSKEPSGDQIQLQILDWSLKLTSSQGLESLEKSFWSHFEAFASKIIVKLRMLDTYNSYEKHLHDKFK